MELADDGRDGEVVLLDRRLGRNGVRKRGDELDELLLNPRSVSKLVDNKLGILEWCWFFFTSACTVEPDMRYAVHHERT